MAIFCRFATEGERGTWRLSAVLFFAALHFALVGGASPALGQCVTSGVDKVCTNTGVLIVPPGGFGISTASGHDNFVTNSGSIIGTLNNFGISAAAANNNVITNTGTISVDQFGISAAAGNSNIITNFGTVSGGVFGMSLASSNNVIVNGGTIAGGIFAIAAAGNNFTLTSLPGSRIIGAISVASLASSANFLGGNYLYSGLGSAIVNTNGAPFVSFGGSIAVLDPTPFAMTDRTLMDFTRGVSSALGDRFDGMAVTGPIKTLAFTEANNSSNRFDDVLASIPGMSAYAADVVTFKNPTMQYADGSSVWARGFAGQRTQQADGILLHARDLFYGGMIGGDWQAQPNLRLGAFVGAGKTRTNIDFSYGNTDNDLVFGGVFGRYTWVSSFLNIAVQAGHSNNFTTRNIANNLAQGGLESATASYDGWYFSPEATYGRNIELGSLAGASYMLTPSVQLRYLYGSFGGYTESGSAANLTVGSQTIGNFEERGQLKLARTQVFTPTQMLITSVYGGLLGDQRVGDTTIGATLLGQAIPFATPGKGNVWGGFGGFGMEFLAGRVSWFASAEYLALSDSSSVVGGKGGIRVAF